MLLSAIFLIRLTTWLLFLPVLLTNLALCICISNERHLDNRLRSFNSIFLYYAYSNLALLVVYTVVLPVFLPARGLVYIAFCGPVTWIFGEVQMRFALCVIIGILSYLVFLPTVSLVLRWMAVMKILPCSTLTRSMTSKIFLLFSFPPAIFTAIFLFLGDNFDKNHTVQSHEKAVSTLLVAKDFPFLAVELNISTWLLSIFGAFFVVFCVSMVLHKLIVMRHITSEHIELGYHLSTMVSHTFLSMNIQNVILITVPHLVLSLSTLIKWELGVRAIPLTFGCFCLPLTTSVTLFVHFRVYRRQLGFLMLELLRHTNISFPVGQLDTQTHHVSSDEHPDEHHEIPDIPEIPHIPPVPNYPTTFPDYDYQI